MNNIYEILIILFVGIVFGISLFEVLIPYFRKIKFGQSIRGEGPKSHVVKNGTPTMGGVANLICTLVLWFIFLIFNFKAKISCFSEVILIFVSFIGFSLIGFLDDYLIVIKKNNIGLLPKYKFILQLIISIICYVLILNIKKSSEINFFGTKIDLKFLYGIFLLITYTGFSNATNLTDGLDGLLSGSFVIILTGIGVVAFINDKYSVLYFVLSILISLISFLIFNLPKASIFMGDTGSLAIGGVLVSLLVLMGLDILIFIFGILYLIETITVILQVWFFKKTKGKRLFKMTPIHHHFELLGFKDYQINILFWFITLFFTIIGVYLGVKIF